jgi:hypothetical protein
VGLLIELSEQAAARVAAAARVRGVSEAVIVEELTQTLASTESAGTRDVLDAFIGCGSSGERHGHTIHELRDELSAAQLSDSLTGPSSHADR